MGRNTGQRGATSSPPGNTRRRGTSSNSVSGLVITRGPLSPRLRGRPARSRTLSKTTGTALTRGTSFENKANLPAAFWNRIVAQYEGTRLGRQEIYAEILDDVEGALWRYAWIADNRVSIAPELERIVVAIDPAVTHGPDSDETGIAAAGLGVDGDFYPLAGGGYRLSPHGWAEKAIQIYDLYEADRMIAERNNGGDLVETNIRHVRKNLPVTTIHASRGKKVRAEPIALLYEQGRCITWVCTNR